MMQIGVRKRNTLSERKPTATPNTEIALAVLHRVQKVVLSGKSLHGHVSQTWLSSFPSPLSDQIGCSHFLMFLWNLALHVDECLEL